jgi:hypothetical protein
MVSSISADLGGSLAAAAPVDPPLLIGKKLNHTWPLPY